MDEIKKTKQTFRILNMSEAYTAPVYKYDQKLNIVTWGNRNDYPNYLLDLYNNYGSSLHKSIINKKVKLISGKGLADVVDPDLQQFIDKNNLDSDVKKISLDYEIFNAFAFEIIYSNDGSLNSLKHIPISKIRIGIENDELDFPHVWVSADWSKYKKTGYEPEMVRLFNPYMKQGKSIYFYNEYNPQTDGLYAIPQYSTAMNYIELGYEISKFHLNQAKQGYSPSFILNFATGIPSIEEQDEFYDQFKREYSGTDNSGKIIITYSEGADGKPELIPVQLNDSDERFITLNEQIQENIVMSSEMPPQLVILTPGKLGSTDERIELQNEFQDFYITPRQEVIEGVMNEILGIEFNEEVKLKEFKEDKVDAVGDTTTSTVNETPNDIEAQAKASLKGSVGGVQGILSIQQSVSEGTTDYTSALAILDLIYGISEADARRILGNVEIINENNTPQ